LNTTKLLLVNKILMKVSYQPNENTQTLVLLSYIHFHELLNSYMYFMACCTKQRILLCFRRPVRTGHSQWCIWSV